MDVAVALKCFEFRACSDLCPVNKIVLDTYVHVGDNEIVSHAWVSQLEMRLET